MAKGPTEADIKSLPAPIKGNRVHFLGSDPAGFGLRVTSAGARSFILDYRTKAGRQRRLTIGSYPTWKLGAARDQAKEYRRIVDAGGDPLADREEAREAEAEEKARPDINALADRFMDEHVSKRREATRRDYEALLRLYIRPHLGKLKVADVTAEDIEKLHREVAAKAKYQANRALSVLSKMFSLAIRWKLRADNPVKGIERAQEEKRERFLTPAEVGRLADALAAHGERVSADAIKLLLLTGARRMEVLSMRWAHLDLEAGVWVKPSAHTKQKKEHRVPLSAPALALLTEIRDRAHNTGCPFVFPGDPIVDDDGKLTFRHIAEVKKSWLAVCKAAGLAVEEPVVGEDGKPVLDKDGNSVTAWRSTVRLHDLRHSYASFLASAGMSLPIIGRLLGHSQPATTARYAHLFDDALRAATEHVGAIVSGRKATA